LIEALSSTIFQIFSGCIPLPARKKIPQGGALPSPAGFYIFDERDDITTLLRLFLASYNAISAFRINCSIEMLLVGVAE
jgi:hypothetical protein